MKKLLLILLAFFALSCNSDRGDEKKSTEITYSIPDAVGFWKVTHFDNPNSNNGWEVERNNRSITFGSDNKFTSFSLTESITTQLSGSYTIDSKGLIRTTNLNLTARDLTMFLSDKTNAVITISSIPGSNIMRKYKVVKQ